MEDQNMKNFEGFMKEHQQNKKLVASEIGELFANYLGDSLSVCVFQHFLEVVEDDEGRDFIEFALAVSQKHLTHIEKIYTQEEIPLPAAFGEQDIRRGAPRLFSDIFMVYYTTEMARAAFLAYGSAFSTSYRYDVVEYFDMCLRNISVIYKKGMALLLSKGVDISSPEIPYPHKVDFVEKESFITFLGGKTRPLTGLEIKHLQLNIFTNVLGKALMLAFSQVGSSEKIRAFFREGAQLADKQIKQLGNFLVSEDLPVPSVMDAHITDSTTPPFSDKLMLYLATMANATGLANYGVAISKMMRHDLHSQFTTLSVGVANYANDALKLNVNCGWMEEPPTAADRKKLSKNSNGTKK